LGSEVYKTLTKQFRDIVLQKAATAYAFSLRKPGVTQTASVAAPYIYEEDNWVDDMELAATTQKHFGEAFNYAKQEPVTPWLGADTAKHYQWYPFINLGHYELAKQLKGER
jgi:hypothetical protein